MKRQLNGEILIESNGKYSQNANTPLFIIVAIFHVRIANTSQDIENTNKTGPILFYY